MQRRSYIKATGTMVLTTIPFVSPAGATKEFIAAAEVGLKEEIADLLLKGKMSEAEKIMEENNIKYDISKTTLGNDSSSRLSPDSGPEISPQGHYDDSDSELYIAVTNGEDDVWFVTTTMTLADRKLSARDASIVNDGFSISYDSTEWSALQPTKSGVTTWSSTEADNSVSLDYQEFKPNRGVAYNVDLPWDMGGETQASLQTELTMNESTGNSNIPVKAEYNHTWATVDLIGPVNASASANIGPVGLEMSLDNASVLWEDEITAEAGESDTIS